MARLGLERSAAVLSRVAEGAVRARTPHLVALARGPARALRRERLALNQKTREIRAASERGIAERFDFQRRLASVVLERARRRAAGAEMERRRAALHRAEVALRAHEPERTLERGYALVEDRQGEPVTDTGAASAAERVRLRFADGTVGAQIEENQ
jgi:exodeoxyribonuclease VII large subunit